MPRDDAASPAALVTRESPRRRLTAALLGPKHHPRNAMTTPSASTARVALRTNRTRMSNRSAAAAADCALVMKSSRPMPNPPSSSAAPTARASPAPTAHWRRFGATNAASSRSTITAHGATDAAVVAMR